MRLTESQEGAVDMVARLPKLALLTGGPGTGKTTTTRAIVEELRASGRDVLLVAPSGKAAQRLEEATGRPASTIHRALGLRPGKEADPVEADVVVVDEASMIDVRLMEELLRGCFDGGLASTVLLVGDPDQLPPVGPGSPFHDLVATPGVAPHVHLEEVHRQALDSGIVRAAHAIRAGRAPKWAADFRLVRVEEAKDVPERVLRLLQDEDLDPETSQVLVPQRTGRAGTGSINDLVSERVLHASAPVYRGLRQGVKVIQTRNNYDFPDPVYNGETGWVCQASPGEDYLVASIGGQVLTYHGAQAEELEPAWALTVHKSQGSEWEDVVIVVHPSHAYMLTRSLLYVAATRARRRVWIVGTEGAVDDAVRRDRDTRRRTYLRRLLARAANNRRAS